jgi:hypothetical protein
LDSQKENVTYQAETVGATALTAAEIYPSLTGELLVVGVVDRVVLGTVVHGGW